MRAFPSVRACVELIVLRRRLPRMLDRESLDALLGRLAAWPTRSRPLKRERLEASITAAEAVVVRLGLPNTCLYRSMGRYALLRGNGVPALFCMGVRPPPDETGHAWVEDEEGPYREEIEDGQYVVTFFHPPESDEAPTSAPEGTSSNLGRGPSNEVLERLR